MRAEMEVRTNLPGWGPGLDQDARDGEIFAAVIGPSKDVNMSANEVGSAAFMHNGPVGSITGEAKVVNASALDVIPQSSVAPSNP